MTTRNVDTVVIGAGLAGLCMSHALQETGRPHVVLEQARPLEQWRTARWDLFRINSPLAYSRLTGQSDDLPDSLQGLPLNKSLALWDSCIAQRRFPIEVQCKVVGVSLENDGRFTVRVQGRAGATTYLARNVVAAAGACQTPCVPACASRLGSDVEQLRVGTYRNPDHVRPGAILVVGGGQTGVQLSEELARAGRSVYLATSRVKGSPRTYRGEDIMFWLDRTGLLWTPRDALKDVEDLFDSMPIVGADHPISHRSLARWGVTLLGRLRDFSSDGKVALFDDDLAANMAHASEGHDRLIALIEAWISGLDEPDRHSYAQALIEPDWLGSAAHDFGAAPTRLDLAERGIRTVIWATGWQARFDWLEIEPVRRALGANGLPSSCDTPAEGFFWLGFAWLRTRSSGFAAGFSRDAAYVASRLRATQA